MKKYCIKLIKNKLTKIKNFGRWVQNFLSEFSFPDSAKSSELNEELTKYINKIFEQQEKERIIKWLINSIRESLDLDTVLSTLVDKTGKMLEVDRCLIALYEKQEKYFYYCSEYLKDSTISTAIKDRGSKCNIPALWQEQLINTFKLIVINDYSEFRLNPEYINYLERNGIKSIVIIPVVDKDDILGIIMVHQIEYSRKWEVDQIELLTDIGGQVAVAIGQAILYSKIQETTRLKSEFLAGMSHELRTPLNAITGFSEMLLTEDFGKLNEKQKKFLRNISVSGEHLLRIVNDILDLSKIESGNMELNYEVFNLYSATTEVISVLKGLAMRKKIHISMDLNANLSIRADLRKFKQIMYNLLSNSIKFTPEEGNVQVTAYVENKNLKVEVQDNGVGISPTDRDKVFMSFRQLDSSLTRKQEGTGLGLTLTKKLVELHKGEIGFESGQDTGSKFWFVLPSIKNETTQETSFVSCKDKELF